MELNLRNRIIIAIIIFVTLGIIGFFFYFYGSEKVFVTEKPGSDIITGDVVISGNDNLELVKTGDEIISEIELNSGEIDIVKSFSGEEKEIIIDTGVKISENDIEKEIFKEQIEPVVDEEIVVKSDHVLTGNAPLGTDKIKITRTNGNKKTDYELKKYKKGETERKSNLQLEYGNIDQGKNTYEITYFSSGQETYKETKTLIGNFSLENYLECSFSMKVFDEKIRPQGSSNGGNVKDSNRYSQKCSVVKGKNITSTIMYFKNIEKTFGEESYFSEIYDTNKNLIVKKGTIILLGGGDYNPTSFRYYFGEKIFTRDFNGGFHSTEISSETKLKISIVSSNSYNTDPASFTIWNDKKKLSLEIVIENQQYRGLKAKLYDDGKLSKEWTIKTLEQNHSCSDDVKGFVEHRLDIPNNVVYLTVYPCEKSKGSGEKILTIDLSTIEIK